MIHGEKKSSNHVSSKKYRGRGGRRSRYIAIQIFILFTVISLETRHVAAMAEWLRRWTRNPMGSSRAGSNPARSGFTFLLCTQSLTSLRQSFNTYDEKDFCSISEKDAVNAAFF